MTTRSAAAEMGCTYRRTGHNPGTGVQRLEKLTGREREVLLLLGTGLGNRELARELGITERTVKAHIANIVGKMGLQTRTQAAIVAALAHERLCPDRACTRHPISPADRSSEAPAA
ncbi:helix-turn-helix transcriptional regulator [Streptomyces sp. MUSC 14]|uniref:helix-turn-helix domain-containing protein n=1 Tax=Streptomyces sp. MUSC 14 TaxID=1354889 RepID=UPI0009A10F6E|nr:helix-turn-helix transcriptional regulator [Streptomyces sp. MUSC 14]